MAWPADYFVPAKGALLNTPVGGDSRYYQVNELQLEAVRLMANERLTKIGQAGFAAISTPVLRRGSLSGVSQTINLWRNRIQTILPFYLNHNLFPGGSLQGVLRPNNGQSCTDTGFSAWTLASILTYLGLGVGGNWTRIPSRDIFGRSVSGGALQAGDVCYVEHINELLSVLNCLTYTFVFLPGFVQTAVRSGGGGGGPGTCDDAKAEAVTSWNTNTWITTIVQRCYKYDYTSGGPPYHTELTNYRAKLTKNFSSFSSGCSGKVYLTCTPIGTVPTSASVYGDDPASGVDAFTWGEWAGASLSFGGTWVSPIIPNSDTISSWHSLCPLNGQYTGWGIADTWTRDGSAVVYTPTNNTAAVAIVEPDFDYVLP